MHSSRRLTLAALPALILAPATLPAQTAAPLTLVTSDLPPMTIPGGPGQRGVLMDLVEAMLRLADLQAQPEFVPWARAMLRATEKPRTLIVPLNRTPDRDGRFQWLVKLYAQRFAFITLADKPRVDSIAQVRRMRVACLRGSSNLETLRQQGVQMNRVYQSTSVGDMQRALQRGLVDAMYGSELIHTDTWRRNGHDPARLQTGLVLESADIWLAAHSGITDAEKARLQHAHDVLLSDGSAERIFKRYGVKPRAEDLR